MSQSEIKRGWLLGTGEVPVSSTSVHLYMWGWMRQSVTAIGVGLLPLAFVCASDSNWGDWDPGTAPGQTEFLSPAAGGIHAVPMYVYILTSGPSQCSATEGSHWGYLCSSECWMCMSMLICVTGHVYMCVCGVHVCLCLLGVHGQPHYWLDLGMWSYGRIASLGLLNPCLFH